MTTPRSAARGDKNTTIWKSVTRCVESFLTHCVDFCCNREWHHQQAQTLSFQSMPPSSPKVPWRARYDGFQNERSITFPTVVIRKQPELGRAGSARKFRAEPSYDRDLMCIKLRTTSSTRHRFQRFQMRLKADQLSFQMHFESIKTVLCRGRFAIFYAKKNKTHNFTNLIILPPLCVP